MNEAIKREIDWLERLAILGGWRVDHEPVSVTGLPVPMSIGILFNEPVDLDRAYAFDAVCEGLIRESPYSIETVWLQATGDLAFPEPATSVLLTWILR